MTGVATREDREDRGPRSDENVCPRFVLPDQTGAHAHIHLRPYNEFHRTVCVSRRLTQSESGQTQSESVQLNSSTKLKQSTHAK